jgi:cytochrome c-type biogenesis protein CcmH/NrfG
MSNAKQTDGNAARTSPQSEGLWTSREAYLLATVCLLFGLVLGYLFRGSSSVTTPSETTASASAPAAMPPAPAVGTAPMSVAAMEPLAAPMLAAVKAEPKNADAWTQLGNLYFDHKFYEKAIEYYSKALELAPKNANVRTDLGTAYWYLGNAKQAVAEYEKSLQADPGHVNTLLNMGIVKKNGLQDTKGAIAAWEKLLNMHPELPDKQRVQDMIADARASQK